METQPPPPAARALQKQVKIFQFKNKGRKWHGGIARHISDLGSEPEKILASRVMARNGGHFSAATRASWDAKTEIAGKDAKGCFNALFEMTHRFKRFEARLTAIRMVAAKRRAV